MLDSQLHRSVTANVGLLSAQNYEIFMPSLRTFRIRVALPLAIVEYFRLESQCRYVSLFGIKKGTETNRTFGGICALRRCLDC
jgi:hypothetical protein